MTAQAQGHPHAEEAGSGKKTSAALLSVAINLALILTEGAIFLFTGSLSVFADAAHSLFDLAASVFAVWGVRMAARPPSRLHPYGHEKFENVSSLIQVLMIGIIALVVVGEVAFNLANGYDLHVSMAAVAVLGVTVFVDLGAARYIGSVAEEHHSYALEADAYHFTTDLWAKLAALGGLTAARFGADWVDPIGALTVAAIMLYIAAKLGLRSTGVLLDRAPGGPLEEQVRQILAEEAGPNGYHSLRMRQSGKWVFLDVVVHVPTASTFAEAHQRAHQVSTRLREEIPQVRDAIVHVEPEDHVQHADGAHYDG